MTWRCRNTHGHSKGSIHRHGSVQARDKPDIPLNPEPAPPIPRPCSTPSSKTLGRQSGSPLSEPLLVELHGVKPSITKRIPLPGAGVQGLKEYRSRNPHVSVLCPKCTPPHAPVARPLAALRAHDTADGQNPALPIIRNIP